MRKQFVLAVCLFLLPVLAFGQAQTSGRIDGTVKDEAGQPVAPATPAMQGERATVTDENGKFLASLLPPGDYTVTFTMPELATTRATLRLGVGQTIPLGITMRGSTQIVEEVTVTGDVSKLETTTGGENFNFTTQVEQLPITNRTLENIATLAPNVSFGPSASTVTIAGAPSFDTVVLLDGAEVSDPYFGSAPDLYLEDAIEEVQVMTTGIGARYGRFQGGVINATTKSGGNTFDGTFRTELTNQDWNSTTPFPGEQQTDKLNKVFQATLGGPIVKDHLWFFAAGRTIPTQETSRQTGNTGLNFTRERDEDRWQLKLRGALTSNHTLEGGYTEYDASVSNYDGLPAGDLRALGQREDPRTTRTLEYQGVLTDRTFVEAQGTQKRVEIKSGAVTAGRSPFMEFYDLATASFQLFNNAWWDYDDASVRDNDTLSAALTHVLSTGRWGEHTFEGGVQYVNSTTAGENKQSATGFNLLNYDVAIYGEDAAPFQTGSPTDPRFNLISLFNGTDLDGDGVADPGITYRWEAIPFPGEQELENTAVYLQDTWEIGKWRVDAGLRWEQYDSRGPSRALDLKFDDWSPRLGVTYNLDENWQLQATWGRYISRFNDNIAGNISGVGAAPYVISFYTGPNVAGATYDELEAILRDDANWEAVVKITDPNQPTRFFAPDTSAPYADDFNFSVKHALPRNTGSVTLTYTDREYHDLLESFIGGLGAVTVTDPFGSGAESEFDREVWGNSDFATRDYEGIALTLDFRPGPVWDLGGNYTYSKTKGNYEGEGLNQPASGSIIGNYPASLVLANAAPYGYTDDDVRHRVRLWGNYRLDFKRAGNLSIGGLFQYRSGTNWSRIGSLPLADLPEYLNEAGQRYTYFFDGRGNNRFPGFWQLDTSLRYQLPVWRDLAAWIKLNVQNVTDEDELIAYRTSGTLSTDASGNVVGWSPTSTFGQARSPLDYQTPRTFQLTVGVQF